MSKKNRDNSDNDRWKKFVDDSTEYMTIRDKDGNILNKDSVKYKKGEDKDEIKE